MRTVQGCVLIAGVTVALLFTAPASAAIPKSEFISRGDEICDSFKPRIHRSVQDIKFSTGFQQLARNTEHSMLVFKQQVRAVKALPNPTAGLKQLRRWYRLTEKWRSVFSEVADQARDRDVDAIQHQLERADRVVGPKKRAARRFGFRTCR